MSHSYLKPVHHIQEHHCTGMNTYPYEKEEFTTWGNNAVLGVFVERAAIVYLYLSYVFDFSKPKVLYVWHICKSNGNVHTTLVKWLLPHSSDV